MNGVLPRTKPLNPTPQQSNCDTKAAQIQRQFPCLIYSDTAPDQPGRDNTEVPLAERKSSKELKNNGAN
jgi:hypothetical protein